MKSIITVVGKDQVGIIAGVCNILAKNDVNVLDINQSILDGYFNMFMIVELVSSGDKFKLIKEKLKSLSKDKGIEITIQRTKLFDEMYQISRSSL